MTVLVAKAVATTFTRSASVAVSESMAGIASTTGLFVAHATILVVISRKALGVFSSCSRNYPLVGDRFRDDLTYTAPLKMTVH